MFDSVDGMGSQQDEICAALDAADAGYARLRAACSDNVGNAYRVEVAERLETQHRINRGQMYRFFGELIDPPDGPDDPDLPAGTVMSRLLWQRLRINTGEVHRRIRLAARIRPRRTPTQPELPAELPHLAAAVEEGAVDDDHIDAICKALDVLPSALSATNKEMSERNLVRHAKSQDANFVTTIGKRIADHLNPDGCFDENDRARRRGLTLGPQQPDGMSRLAGWVDPENRAYLEAANAAVRPGRHQPESDSPHQHVEVTPDARTASQRLHDAVKLGMKAGLASGEFGQHRGMPVTVIVTTTLGELNQAAHAVNNPPIPMPPPARTGGGSALPMRELIRMAADAIHYLAVFEDHTNRPLYLGRSKRVASADQRIICYARDRGCTRPGCTEPGYHCEVHHDPPWDPDGRTDADCLWFGCGPDHTLLSKGILQTKVTDTGRLAWTAAPARPKSTSPTTPTNYSPNSTKTTKTTDAQWRTAALLEGCWGDRGSHPLGHRPELRRRPSPPARRPVRPRERPLVDGVQDPGRPRDRRGVPVAV
jgi:Domain of unknown function (DUF222)